MDKFNEVRIAIASINQGSVQRALYLLLDLLEEQQCRFGVVQEIDVDNMYPETTEPTGAIPEKE